MEALMTTANEQIAFIPRKNIEYCYIQEFGPININISYDTLITNYDY